MTGRIYLVRHAEATHNVTHNFDLHDPPLSSPLGIFQAENLGKEFPYHERIAAIVSSPLRRTIQTTLLAFSQSLDKRYSDEETWGVFEGAELILSPDVQESSALPCDTGSDKSILVTEFPNLDFSTLLPNWNLKEGRYEAENSAVQSRAAAVRKFLYHKLDERESADDRRKDIVVVTHGVFMKHLSGDTTIDLPKAGWKSFRLVKSAGGDDFIFEEDSG